MRAIAVIVTLKDGAEAEARRLLDEGPPFVPTEVGFDRHEVFVAPGEIVFVFSGSDVEWALDDLTSDYFRPELRAALESWRPLVEGPPRVAELAFSWSKP